jgi:FMN-dependent oxidoreductase (nitrilotriacetate monooxygenase family)
VAKRSMHLVGHLVTGPVLHHTGGWRHPDSDADLVLDPARYENLARIYEAGKFDGVFIVDGMVLSGISPDSPSPHIEHGMLMFLLDPMLVLAQMARVTRHLGLAATQNTLVTPPFQIARQFATLDHLSHGRAGWNIVTGAIKAVTSNYGIAQLPPAGDRYDHADEVVEACLALWETWDADAVELNKATGRFADPAKVHYVTYQGKQVKLEGGLPTPRSPQGHPVFLQAGASARGKRFAARWAEAIFTIQRDKASAQAFYGEIKDLVDSEGRFPDSCKVLPAVEVFVDKSQAAAEERAEALDSLADPRAGLSALSSIFGRNVLDDPLDTPVSQVPVGPAGPPVEGTYQNVLGMRVRGREATLGEVAHLQATTHLSPRFVGTPESVADQMQDLFESGGCDGFVITHALSPGSLSSFVSLAVPELQRRGIFRREYTGATFRENLGT